MKPQIQMIPSWCLSHSTWSSHVFSSPSRYFLSSASNFFPNVSREGPVGCILKGGLERVVVDFPNHMRAGRVRYSPFGEGDSLGSTIARDSVKHSGRIDRRWRRRGYARTSFVPRFDSPLRAALRAVRWYDPVLTCSLRIIPPHAVGVRVYTSAVWRHEVLAHQICVRVRVCVWMCAWNARRSTIRKENGRSRFDMIDIYPERVKELTSSARSFYRALI